MAVPAPHSPWVAGTDYTTAALLQTISDSILYWSGATTSTGQRKPLCMVKQTVAQSIPNATWTAATFDTEVLDYGNNHVTTAGSNDKFTATDPGVHWVAGGCGFVANATGRRGVRYSVNGTAVDGSTSFVPDSNVGAVVSGRAMAIYLNAGDVLRMEVFQNSGGALSTVVSGTDLEPALSVVLVSN